MITKFSKYIKSTSKEDDINKDKVIKRVNDVKKERLDYLRKVNKDVKKVDESVAKINDQFKVKTIFSIPTDTIKKYIEKVKAEEGKNPLEFWSAADIAEEMVKYILDEYLTVDNVPASLVFGDTKTRDDEEKEAEDVDVEVEENTDENSESETAEEDFNKDNEENVEVEEEETSFGMSDTFTDNDIKFYNK